MEPGANDGRGDLAACPQAGMMNFPNDTDPTMTQDTQALEAAARAASAAILDHLPLILSDTEADNAKAARLVQAISDVLAADAELRPRPDGGKVFLEGFFEVFKVPDRP